MGQLKSINRRKTSKVGEGEWCEGGEKGNALGTDMQLIKFHVCMIISKGLKHIV